MDWLDPDIPRAPKDMKGFYYDFFKEFREYLAEYIRDSVVELSIAELLIKQPTKIFDGYTPGKAKLKNQGLVPVFLSATGQGGYRLDPGETVEFFVNTQVIATTVSGTAVLGFIRS